MSTTVLENVEGFSDRQNTLVLSLSGGELRNIVQHVVFFPGDVQNFHDKMNESLHGKMWSDWSYEQVSKLLSKRFPQSMVWLVQPSRMHDHIFSCYDNFLPSNLFGAPESTSDFDATKHVQMLLQRGCHTFLTKHASKIGKCVSDKEDLTSVLDLESTLKVLPVTLVGFSKGCVVLNQIVCELGPCTQRVDVTPDENDVCLLNRVTSFFWLDGGHSELDTNAWITDRAVLSKLASLGCEVRVHVTPWQIHDPSRPHIGMQERLFVDTLRACGGNVTENLHFPDERKFEKHFRVLEEF